MKMCSTTVLYSLVRYTVSVRTLQSDSITPGRQTVTPTIEHRFTSHLISTLFPHSLSFFTSFQIMCVVFLLNFLKFLRRNKSKSEKEFCTDVFIEFFF